MTQDETKKRAPGCLTHIVIYAVALVAMYFAVTPESTGNFTENQARSFRIAIVRLKATPPEPSYGSISLAALQEKPPKIDLSSVSFLLPQDVTNIYPNSGDINKATVLERHPDWQLVEYRFGNTHDSVSRYRAFKDRIEPVSYRVTMGPALMLYAIVLLLPVWLVSALVNAIWNAVAGRKKSPDAS